MKKTILIALGLLSGAVALAAVTSEQNIKVDNVVIGRPSPATDPQISFKGTTPKIKANRTTTKLQFTNDGTTYKNLGSGSGGSGGTNLLADDNFDFEVGTPFTGWTASGGTVTAETTNPLFDDKSLKWDSSASSQTLTSATKTIKAGFVGRSCQAEIYYKWPSGVSGDLTLEARDGTPATVATINLNPTVGDAVTRAQLQFDCPALAGTLTLRLLSNVSNPAEITIDNAFIGSGNSSFNLSQARLLGSVVITGCSAAWSTTSATFVDFTAATSCSYATSGSAQAPSTNIPGIKFASMPPGEYVIQYEGVTGVSTANNSATFQFWDGANAAREQSSIGIGSAVSAINGNGVNQSISYATAQTNVTLSLRGKTTGGAAGTISGTTGNPGVIKVYFYPSTSAEAITLETSGWRVDANIGGANPDLGTADQTAYVGIENASLDLVNNTGSNVIVAQIPCSSTNPPTGLTCSAGNESLGVSFNVPQSGDVVACASFGHNANVGAGGLINTVFQVVETASNAQTVLQEGRSRVVSANATPSTNITTPNRVCGTFTFSSAGQKTLRLMYEQDNTATITNNILLLDRDAVKGQRDLHWEVYPINQQMPAPVFTGYTAALNARVSSSAISYRVENARVTCSGSSAIAAGGGDNWLTAVTNIASGICTLTIAGGIFTATPTCLATVQSGTSFAAGIGSLTNVSLPFRIYNTTTNANSTGDTVHIMCMGPK